MNRLLIILPILLLCGCATKRAASPLRAAPLNATVTLLWDASPSPEVIGYRLYHWTTGPTNKVSLGNVTQTTYANVVRGATNRFYVTAFSTDAESAPSNLLEYTPPLAPPDALRVAVFYLQFQNFDLTGWTNIASVAVTNPPEGMFRLEQQFVQ